MRILALELSTAKASLGWSDDVNCEVLEWPNDRKDSGLFFKNLAGIVKRVGLPEKIMVGLGPGSYAGVRIAISAAVGLQKAAGAELLGYPSVCSMSDQDGDYAVVGDARRKSFFFVQIRNQVLSGPYELLSEADLKTRIDRLAPDFALFSSDLLPQFQPRVELRYPSAEVLMRLAAGDSREFLRPPLEPIYLREANVTMPKAIMGAVIR
jgi:tRNA threonylcarbamoyl adenosine modification protein YeaZ